MLTLKQCREFLNQEIEFAKSEDMPETAQKLADVLTYIIQYQIAELLINNDVFETENKKKWVKKITTL